MDAKNSLSMLLSGLQRLDVLPSATLTEVLQRPEAQGDDPQPLGRWLFQQGFLTRYQLNQLATGRDDDLVIGPYILMDKIAEGGGGQVFKARHKVMNRIVALKRIRPELLSRPDLVQRFFQEAQLAAQLDHPNVVRAFDAGQVGPSCYLAMEFVDGIDLTRLVCDSGPLSVALACDFIRQAASGLQHAHERGLVHRDIKPSNMLVTPVFATNNGAAMAKPGAVIKILDLGLARWQTEPTTGEGRGLGTPQFVAPEQAKSGDAADIRSDLYSIGCTFFYLLAGQPPFEGTRQEILQQHLHEPAPRVDTLRPGVPADVVDVIGKLLKKNPAERFATPKELVAALDKIRRHLGPEGPVTVLQPVQPPPRPTSVADTTVGSSEFDKISNEGATPRPRSTGRRHSASTGKKSLVFVFGIGLHLVAAAIVIGVLWWKFGRTSEKTSDKDDTQPIAKVKPVSEKPKVTPPKKAPDGAVEKPKAPPPKTTGPFARGTPPDGQEPLDTVRINHEPILKRAFPQKPPVLQKLSSTPTGGVKNLAYVPSQPPRLLYADRQLRVLDSDTGKQVGEMPGDSMDFIEANPNGRFAVGLSKQRLQTWKLEPVDAPQTIADGVTSFAHSANGNYVLAGHADNSVRLWNLMSRQVDRSIEIGEPITAVTLAPNGWLAMIGTERGQILFFDLESQTKLASAHRHQEAIRSLAVSPDGDVVASVGEDRKILTWSTKDGRPRDFMPLDQPLHYVDFVGADWGVAGSRGGRMYCFHLPSRTAVSYGDANMGPLQALTVSSNRRFVYAAFSDLGVCRLDYDPPPEPPVVVQPPPPPPPMPTPPVIKDRLQEATVLVEQTLSKPNQAQRIRFSPDGHALAASGSDGTLLLFSATANAAPTAIASAADSHQSVWWVANKLVSTIGFINPKDKTIAKHVTPQPVSAVHTTGVTTSDLVILGLENGSIYRVKPNLPVYNSFWPVFDQRIIAVAMTKDGKQAIVATPDKLFLCPLDRADPKPRELASQSGRNRWLSYLPGDTRALCVDEKSVVLVDVREGKVIRTMPLPAAGSIRAASVSADGSHVLLCLSDTIFAVAIETGEIVGRLPLETYTVIHGVDVSPDGRRLAAATEKNVIVWELANTLNAGPNP